MEEGVTLWEWITPFKWFTVLNKGQIWKNKSHLEKCVTGKFRATLYKIVYNVNYWSHSEKMDHSVKRKSQFMWAKVWKMGHSVKKWATLWNGLQCKTSITRQTKWVTFGRKSKWVTLWKVGHAVKSASYLEKLVTLWKLIT